jgi:adenine-specific DNA-methyltransferase
LANYLDTLLSKIDDGNLKSALSSEIQSLRDAKKFGLVFERHIPERVRLLNHPITPGVFVTLRKEQGQDRWLVKTVSGDVASLERDDGTELFETEMPVKDLVVVRDFGEAIYPGLKSVGSIIRRGVNSG